MQVTIHGPSKELHAGVVQHPTTGRQLPAILFVTEDNVCYVHAFDTPEQVRTFCAALMAAAIDTGVIGADDHAQGTTH